MIAPLTRAPKLHAYFWDGEGSRRARCGVHASTNRIVTTGAFAGDWPRHSLQKCRRCIRSIALEQGRRREAAGRG